MAGRTSERAMVLWRADWSASPVIEGGPFLGSTLGRPARRIVVGSCLAPFAMVKRANEECGAATYPSGDSPDCHPYQSAKYKYKIHV